MKEFYSLALSTFFAKKNKGLQFLAGLFFFTSQIAFGQVSGTVFRDFNGDGAKGATEPLISGITVNAYKDITLRLDR